jgi:superfamily I DNA and/or RNA helicase/very-short-patch-repair endonuclease
MNKQFVTYLNNKLKTGNLHTIHLNALPERYVTRLDLTSLDLINGKDGATEIFPSSSDRVSEDFLLQNLLSKPKFQYKISFDDVPFSSLSLEDKKLYDDLAKRLNAIYNQNEDNFLEHGIRTFGFGYPLLIKQSATDPSKIIKAPLLIWSLDIHRSNATKNQWVISKSPDAPIYVNDVLLSYINTEESINIDEAPIHFPENNLISVEQLQEVLHTLLSKFSYEVKDLEIQVNPVLDKASIEESASQTPQILWSGILGMFRTQKQSIIKDTDQMIANFDQMGFNDLGLKTPRLSNNTSVDSDPSQEEIIRTLDEREFKVIQGPPGTGKSQSLTAIITNTLENQGKVLVVCEKKTALNVIFSNLQKLGLEKLVAIIDDVDRDRKKIVSSVRQITDVVKLKHQRFNEKNYSSKLKRYNKLTLEFNRKHRNLLKNTFRDFNLKEIITDYLRYKRSSPVDEILFENVELELSEREFDYINRYIEQGCDLFSDVDPKAYVFDGLAARFFEEMSYSIKNERAMFETIQQEKQFLLEVGIDNLSLAKAPVVLDEFPATIKTTFDFKLFRNMVQTVEHALQFWEERYRLLLKLNQHLEHTSIIRPNGFSMKVRRLSLFYQKIYNHIKTLTELQEQLEKLQIVVQTIPNVETLETLKQTGSTKAMKLFSSKAKVINSFWQKAPPICLKINKMLKKSNFQKVENELFEEEKQTVPRMEDVLYITEQLDKCIQNKPVFKEYFEWRIFFESTTVLIQNCLNILREASSPEHWDPIFKYNYLYLLIDLESARLGEFNTNSKTLEKIIEIQAELQRLQKRKILKTWEAKQHQNIRKFNKESNIKWLFNHRKNSKYSRKNSLRNILHEEFDLFTNIFPVVLVNPVVASSIMPLKPNLFDVVLFDEASQLRLEDTYPSLIRGRIKVISGDKHQMPPSNYFSSDISVDSNDFLSDLANKNDSFDKGNPLYLAESESLLEFGNNLNPNRVHTSYLDFHYRSYHPDLINFSNAAFYGSRLISLPAKNSYKPLRFFHLEGIYNNNGSNLVEATRIINFLKEDYPINEDGTYPSLGIATFNMQQRNLIKDLIHEQTIQDSHFRQKMNKIGFEDNWFVKNLENVQGDERDIIIISTTFGLNPEGEFKQAFGLLNSKRGYRLLNVIITRAKQQLCVFSSIPKEYFTKYTSDILEKGNRGKAILYAYLDYVYAIEEENQEAKETILDLLKDACDEEGLSIHDDPIETPFEDELYNYLTDIIDEDQLVSDYKMGGYHVDFVVLDANKQPCIAIECDGAPWHNTPQAYAYDLHRQRILGEQGLKIFRVWSKAWWPNPEKELDKLRELILSTCPESLNS